MSAERIRNPRLQPEHGDVLAVGFTKVTRRRVIRANGLLQFRTAGRYRTLMPLDIVAWRRWAKYARVVQMAEEAEAAEGKGQRRRATAE
jgi:hypothetical protein